MDTQHDSFIRRCLEIAATARGAVGTGAMVGAVLVRQGEIIAEGIHPRFGAFHAERNLLLNYEPQIDPADILYVNLEPCVPHPTKKTPPCTGIILERKVRRLVYGMADPDVRVAGRGLTLLREAGVEIEGPILEEECRSFNRGFISVRLKGRPYVTAVTGREIPELAGDVWCFRESKISVPALIVEEARVPELTMRAPSERLILLERPVIAGKNYTGAPLEEVVSALGRADGSYIGATEVVIMCREELLQALRAHSFVDQVR